MKAGSSNKFFYYTSTNISSFNIRFNFFFKEDLKLEAMKEAANKAIKSYPEFAVRPCIKDNRIEFVKNEDEVRFFPFDGKYHNFGSDEVGGYLFFFEYRDKELVFSYYHGMADTDGAMNYIRAVFCEYAQSTGYQMSDDEWKELKDSIRSNECKCTDEDDMYTPYEKYMDNTLTPPYAYPYTPAYKITGGMFDSSYEDRHIYSLTLSTKAFKDKTHEYGVSFIPLLADIVTTSIFENMDVEDDDVVVAMVQVNLRSLFGSKTLVNFSDGVFLPLVKEDLKLSIEERCKKFKEDLLKQKTKENFANILYNKVQDVRKMEGSGEDIYEIAKRRSTPAPVDGPKSPVTYALTSPGRLSISTGIDRMFTDIQCTPFFATFGIVICTFEDKMRLQIVCRSNDDTFPKGIYSNFIKMGFDAKLTDDGLRHGDRMMLDKLTVLRG